MARKRYKPEEIVSLLRQADALDDLSERALTPAVMLGDSHYGSSDNMALTREQNINLVAPARPPKGAVSGRLTLEDFTLNEEGLVLRCPDILRWVLSR